MKASSLDGMSALVTGGGGGFGRTSALVLARDGAAVTLMGRTAATLERARDIILSDYPDARIAIHPGDALNEADVEAAVATAVDFGGGLDIVIPTVGGGSYAGITERSHEDFMRDLEVNVGSAALAVRVAVPRMARGGAFVFISSTAAVLSFTKLASYCAGKAALDHYMRAAANELGPRNIRLNCVRPGLTHTDGLGTHFQNKAYVDGFIPLIPLGRTGMPIDIAEAIRYLAGPEASWVTGQSFAVDGGNELRGAPLA